MSRLDELPPDQHAALSLLVRQRRTYAEVAAMLAISEHAVHDRAHAALAVLAPGLARTLPPEQRERVGDYLLGQDEPGSASEDAARALLAGSAPAREWAQALRGELDPLGGELPALPWAAPSAAAGGTEPVAMPPPRAAPSPAAPAPEGAAAAAAASTGREPVAAPDPQPAAPPQDRPAAQDAAERQPPAGPAGTAPADAPAEPETPAGPPAAGPPDVPPAPAGAAAGPDPAGGDGEADGQTPRSRSGSRVGGAILLAVILAAVAVAVVLIDKGSGHAAHTRTQATTAAKGSKVKVTAQIPLRPPDASSHAVGAVDILAEGSRRAFFIAAEKLPPTSGFYYAIWLYNSPTSARALNRAPRVTSSGTLQGGSVLPADAANYKQILLTRETTSQPTHPGTIALQGSFTLGG